jgi:hypothetical protein
MKEQCLPSHQSTIFHSSLQAHVTTENTIHRLGAWLRLNKQTILASVKHQAQRTSQNPPSTARRSTRAAPTHRTSDSLPRYRQLTIHAALEQSILNQRHAQDPVLVAALQMEAQDDNSTSASRTSTDTQSSYQSSSDESSGDDDSSGEQVRYGEFDCSHRNSRPKVKMKQIHGRTFSTLS